jgi:hypothetical protein
LSLDLSRDFFPCPADVGYGNKSRDLDFRGFRSSASCCISERDTAELGTCVGVIWNAQQPGDLLIQDERVAAGDIGALDQAVDVGDVACDAQNGQPAGKPISWPTSAIVTASRIRWSAAK